jgi:hypothetical protein
MKELRLSIIDNHDDPAEDKRVEIHVTDADAVLGAIKSTPNHALGAGAAELLDLVNTALAKCGDTDKIELGVDQDGKPNPKSAVHYKGDGSGEKVPFAL